MPATTSAMMRDLHASLAALHRDDLVREAEDWRRAREAHRPPRQWRAGQLLRAVMLSCWRGQSIGGPA